MFYQRKSPRHTSYDYTSTGAYFITINTKNRKHCFGKIKNDKMIVNKLGNNSISCRKNIPKHYPFVEIDEYICMPNHIHGILIIGNHHTNRTHAVRTDYHPSSIDPTDRTQNIASLRVDTSPVIGPKSWSLWSIVRGYKIGVTKYAKQNNIPFARQSRYHDHIIRDQEEFNRIKYYIRNNPKNRNG